MSELSETGGHPAGVTESLGGVGETQTTGVRALPVW